MDTDTLNSNSSSSDKIVSRKNFLLAATGVAAYLGMTSRAKASGTQAYLDSVETFTSDQTFAGNAFFTKGDIWVDVTAFKLPTDTTYDSAISLALAAAIPAVGGVATNGTNAKGNFVIYFPPGDYVITNTILPPNSASNYTLKGAGPWSSRLIWEGGSQSMLKLVNARGVTIRDIGFIGGGNTYGIEMNRRAGWTSGTPYPGEILVENAYMGNGSANSMTVAIGYTADATFDTIPCGFGTFRDVFIQNVRTAYSFATAYAYGNNIISGGVAYSTTSAFDNIPGPNSSVGGSYNVYGTSTGGNALLFNIGPTNGYSINIFSLLGESDTLIMSTPADVGAQTVQFFGGLAGGEDPGPDTIFFNSTGGQLEFHGSEFYTSNGGRWHFPGSAAVAFYGGAMGTLQWVFNGPLQFHGMQGLGADYGSAFSNAGSGVIQHFGHNGHFVGSASSIATFASPNAGLNGVMSTVVGSASGTSPTTLVTGSDMGGLITIEAGSGPTTGTLIQVNFAIPFTSSSVSPAVLVFPAESNAAGMLTKVYTQSVGVTGFQLCTSAALVAGTTYQWSYQVIG